jgi:hypothetical protein
MRQFWLHKVLDWGTAEYLILIFRTNQNKRFSEHFTRFSVNVFNSNSGNSFDSKMTSIIHLLVKTLWVQFRAIFILDKAEFI